MYGQGVHARASLAHKPAIRCARQPARKDQSRRDGKWYYDVIFSLIDSHSATHRLIPPLHHRGWQYVNCVEAVATNIGVSDKDLCWKMTTHCRDIFQTNNQPVVMPSDVAVGVGLAAGTLAAILIALAVRGDLFRLLTQVRLSGPTENIAFVPVIDTDVE